MARTNRGRSGLRRNLEITSPERKLFVWAEESHGCHAIYLDDRARVVVHPYIGCGDQLFVSCLALDIDMHLLKSTAVEQAKLEAMRVVRDRAAYLAARIELVKP